MTNKAQHVALYISNHFQYVWESVGFFDLQRLLYLAQGWACLAALKPMIEALPTTSMLMLLAGGILLVTLLASFLHRQFGAGGAGRGA